MTAAQWMWASYGIAALMLMGAWLGARGKGRTIVGNILLGVLTAFVVHFLVVATTTQKLGKTNTAVATDQAEMQLRIMSDMESLRKSWPTGLSKAEEKQLGEAYIAAEKVLEDAIKANPDSKIFPAKLVVVLGADRREEKKAENEKRIHELTATLIESGATDTKFHDLGVAFEHTYVDKAVSKEEEPTFESAIKVALPSGWYQDHALLRLYQSTKNQAKAKEFATAVDDRNVKTIAKVFALALLAFLCGVIGVINVCVQIGLTSRSSEPPPDAVGLPQVSLKSVFAVFVSWFCIQIVMSTAAHAYMAQNKDLLVQPTAVALTTGIGYLLSNIPGPLLIYFIALKPHGLSFWEALRVRFNTSTSGPFKIGFMGWLAWCSAIPIVFSTAFFASKFLHSGHSDNPVIAQIIQAASASNPAAIIIFYFTLGVMAPFFEEILFRGFLYGSLKPRIGSFFAMIASATAFAVMHFDKGGVLMLFAIGFVLAYTFERTRSLVPSMIAHGLWNSGSFTLALVLFS